MGLAVNQGDIPDLERLLRYSNLNTVMIYAVPDMDSLIEYLLHVVTLIVMYTSIR